ncbi:MAG: hypothetical protein CMJ64_01770 [Planctomycetaceae bacterium]|nr:hypothetical protein [Planctomycetaceae bacterium]
MTAVKCFTEIRVWQRARQWSKDIFHRTRREPFAKNYRLVAQINDSSESVMANIAKDSGAARKVSSFSSWDTRLAA